MKNDKPVVGKYILDTLSIGMYNDPFMLLREFIQNSVDSIDRAVRQGMLKRGEGKIDISINAMKRHIQIIDNGAGLSAQEAKSALQDIGKSAKRTTDSRGFRGIGRLGALGYCDLLQFTTKTKGDHLCVQSTWDCKNLKTLLKDEDTFINVSEIVDAVTLFEQKDAKNEVRKHYFVVDMVNVRSPRDILLNVPLIKAYLSQVAPVSFNSESFDCAESIDSNLRQNVPDYDSYSIYLNGECIYKCYSNRVPLGSKSHDTINNVQFVAFQGEYGLLAFGWVADLSLLGAISASSLVDGIRMRSGNILIGDKNLFINYYREKRFNNYVVGEIHAIDKRLVPNSRRDDFEDNDAKEELIDNFVRLIGLPFSKKIRESSLLRSKKRIDQNHSIAIDSGNKVLQQGYIAHNQLERIMKDLRTLQVNNISYDSIHADLLENLKVSKHILDNGKYKIKPATKKILKSMSEIIYKELTDKTEAEKLIIKLINNVSHS